MKLSDMIERGFALVKKQCRGQMCFGNPKAPRAVCANGASSFAATGDAQEFVPGFTSARRAYLATYRETVSESNDRGETIESIVHRLRVIGW
jgi:hypothetical protein